jgi:hypothetical protein
LEKERGMVIRGQKIGKLMLEGREERRRKKARRCRDEKRKRGKNYLETQMETK